MSKISLWTSGLPASQLLLYPVSWSSVDPNAAAINANSTLLPSIQIFGYLPDGKTIYVRVPRKSTFILTFAEEVDDDIISNIMEILNPIYIKRSILDSKVLIVRAPELSPIELTANPDFEGLATWIDVKQDPYGELQSFWEAREIGPYEWLSLEKFVPLPGKYTTCDINLSIDEVNIATAPREIVLPDIFPRLFFWHISTLSSRKGEFPNSSNKEDVISMISITTVAPDGSNSYAIVLPTLNTSLDESILAVNARDEKDLIVQFFAIYTSFKPDRQIYYTGDMVDMPYLLNRSALHNYSIPRISKILSFLPEISYHSYPTPFGREMAPTISLPGTESIDLVHFYRRFYPQFSNYRLGAISDALLDEAENEIFEESTTSARLSELWSVTEVHSRIESVCNNLGVSADVLLRESFADILHRSVYNIDAGAAIITGKKDKPDHFKEAVRGVYRNVLLYDYSELYRRLMVNSGQVIASTLGERLEDAPPGLIMEAFYSEYVDRTKLIPLMNAMLESIISSEKIIAIEPVFIRSVGPLPADWLKLISTIPCYVSVAKASHIILDTRGSIESSGLAKLCRPKFELANDVIRQYITKVYRGRVADFQVPKLEDVASEKFVLSETIGDIMTLKSGSLKYVLAQQYAGILSGWITVKYLMTTKGPVLLSLVKEGEKIDYSYYIREIESYMLELYSLKIYGV